MAKYFKFKKEQIKKAFYGGNDKRTALQIIDESEGYPEVVAIPTVNLPHLALNKDQVFIKNWSENEGVLQDLIEMKVISEPIAEVKTGLVVAYKCKLLI